MSYTRLVVWRVLAVAWVFALRLAAQAAPVAAAEGPASPAPEMTSAHREATGDGADAPFDLDDDDDDPDDAALPAGIALFIPDPVTQLRSWSVGPLATKCTLDPLFRPPRRA